MPSRRFIFKNSYYPRLPTPGETSSFQVIIKSGLKIMNRPLPGTRALRTLEAAGRHLNFTRAANEVGLTPAAVSYQIKEIEDQLGLVLFTRTSRTIRLTAAGAVLVEAAGEALDTLRRAAARARKLGRDAHHLRLSVGARFATNWLLPRLPQWRAAHPGLDLTFDISDDVRDFAGDDVDVAIRYGAGRYAGAVSHRLFDTVVVPVCSPALLARGPAIARPEDLAAHTLCYVDCRPGGIVWPDWPMWMAAAGVPDFDGRRCVAFAESSHVVQAVLEGGAAGLVELELVDRELEQGRLVRLFDVGVKVAPDYAYHLVYPAGSRDDPRVQALQDWLDGEVRRRPSGA
ncbi:LysR family transcriptional regulator, glycine cleavage system transcriptional activator [Achromobacter sp. MFA1 R4]|nr:LysR family transcriptional regulator, glycine cleavage system transcriptional activator [Achromobacter sp. MFA1 R4]